MFNNTRRLVLVIAATFVVTFMALSAFATPATAHSIGPITDIWGNEVGAGLRVEPVDADSNSVGRVEPIKDAGSGVAKNIPLIDLAVKLFKTVTSEITNFVTYYVASNSDQSGVSHVIPAPDDMNDVVYQFVITSIRYMVSRIAVVHY